MDVAIFDGIYFHVTVGERLFKKAFCREPVQPWRETRHFPQQGARRMRGARGCLELSVVSVFPASNCFFQLRDRGPVLLNEHLCRAEWEC